MSGQSIATALLDLSTAAVEFAVNWLLQSSLLIAIGLLAAVILRMRGSAPQSVIYRTTLVAVLICPFATLLLAQSGFSGWSLEMPAAWVLTPADGAEEPSIVATAQDPSIQIAANNSQSPNGEQLPGFGSAAASVPLAPRSLDAAQEQFAETFPVSMRDDTPIAPEASAPVVAAIAPLVQVSQFSVNAFGLVAAALGAVWILVSGALLLKLGMAWWELARLRRRTVPADAATIEICCALAPQLGVWPPAVLRSPYVPSPCLAGLRGAAVLLPDEQIELPIRDVLIHELAHLRRHDCHWKLLHKLATSLFFFQPLLWKLARRIDATSEEVCDDFVMQFGGDRRQYAHGLVDVAELSATPAAAVGAVGVGIVSLRSMLAHRVARIMDTSRTLSTRVGSLLVVLVLVGGLIGTAAVGLVGLKPQASLAEAAAGSSNADESAGVEEENVVEVASVEITDKNEPQGADPAPKNAPAKAPNAKEAAAAGEITGHVLGAGGKPVAGAQVYWFRTRIYDLSPMAPRLVATSNDKGEFKFVPPAAGAKENEAAIWANSERIVIKAPGHGFLVTDPSSLRRGLNQSLLQVLTGAVTLPAAGPPIEGRLVDIDGRPIVGARIRTRYFQDADDARRMIPLAAAQDPKVAAWEQRVNDLLNIIEPAPLREVLPQTTTDADGRFTLSDIGLNRLLQLLVEGQGIETTEIVAQNQSTDSILLPKKPETGEAPITVYGRNLLRAIGPSNPIEGQVLDIDTNEPLANAVVRAILVHGQRVMSSREREEFAVRTDAKGKYRVTGMPIGDKNELVAFTTGDVPYIPIGHELDTSTKEGARQDFQLKRGVWAEGRVFDAESQQPFTGEISYYMFRDKQLQDTIPGIYKGFVDGLYWTNQKGEFRVPVLPSRGVLAYRFDSQGMDRDGIDRFPRGYGADAIAGREANGGYPTAPFYLLAENYERVVEVNPTIGQDIIRADMPLVASAPVQVHVVDAAGKPARKFILYGANERFGWQPMTAADLVVSDLKPKEKRKIFAFDRGRNLAGAATATYDQKETVQIELQPAGSVTGAIVDADQVPIADVILHLNYEKFKEQEDTAIWASVLNQSRQPTDVAVDDKGRFRLDGLVPGWKYNARASAPRKLNGKMQSMSIGVAFSDVTVNPGEVKELGPLVIGARNDIQKTAETKTPVADRAAATKTSQEPAATPPTVPEDFTFNYVGKVVDPLGRGVANAKIYFVFWQHGAQPTDQLKPLASTNAAGQFDFNVKATDLAGPEALASQIVATASGYGVAIGSALDFEITGAARKRLPEAQQIAILKRQAAGRQTVLKLAADDTPITGQMVTTEGRPVPGARVRVKDLWITDAESLDGFEKAAKEPKADYYSLRKQASRGMNGPQLPSIVRDAVTDADGRFTVKGIGRERVVELIISGPGVETKLVKARTRAGDTIVVPHEWGRDSSEIRKETFLPNSLVQVVGPSQTLTGRITDADDGQPLAGILVSAGHAGTFFSAGKPYLATRSDADGQFRLDGMAIDSREEIFVLPPNDSAYLPTATRVTLSLDHPPAVTDFRLKRGVWVRGQAVDKRTGKPIVGHVEYYTFDNNPNLDSFVGFGRGGNVHERRTDSQGHFEIAVLPGAGILTFSPDDHTRFRRGVGTEDIKGPTDSVQGEQKVFLTLPTRLLSTNTHLLHGLDIAADATAMNDVKLELDSGVDIPLKFLDADRTPLDGVIVNGAVFPGGGWYDAKDASSVVQGYYPAAPRDLFCFHPERNLAGHYQLKGAAPAEIEITLQPAGNASGRLLEDDGSPLVGAQLTGAGIPSGNFANDVLKLSTDKDGRFLICGLLPNRKYTILGMKDLTLGNVATDVSVTAGETKDLGDLKLTPMDRAMAPKPSADNKPMKENSSVAKTAQVLLPPAAKDPKADQRTVRGRVVDSNNKPIQGAHVAATAVKLTRSPGGLISSDGVILAEGISDPKGGFSLQFANIDEKTHHGARVVARAENMAINSMKLKLNEQPQEVVLKLQAEEPLRARLVDIDGQPAAGVHCAIRGIMPRSKDYPFRDSDLSIGYKFQSAPAAWIPSVTSNKEGRIVVHGIPAGFGAYLDVDGSERFAPQEAALNSGAPEQRGERDGTYRSLVKNGAAGEEIIVPLAPAQWFEGTVRYEDTGEPAPHARLNIGASQQEFGSTWHLEGKADAAGKYRINPRPGIRFVVTAYPPQGAPYLIRTTPLEKAIPWQTGDRVKQVDMTLKRGVLVRGRVVDEESGAPIVGGSVQYIPESSNNPNDSDDVVTGWEGIVGTNEQGEFQIVALPGPGRLLIHDPDGRHILQEIGSNELHQSKPGGRRNYAHAIRKINPSIDADKPQDEIKIALRPGATVRGRMLDEQGALIQEALVISPLDIRPFWLTWYGSSDATLGGTFEISGLAADQEYLVYFLDPKRKLGATKKIKASDPAPDVVLQPCGEATARFVDAEGHPLKGHQPTLEIVLKPGVHVNDSAAQENGDLAALSAFVSNVDQVNSWDLATDADGRIVFTALIPGARYQLIESKAGRPIRGQEFTVTPSQKLDLGEITAETD